MEYNVKLPLAAQEPFSMYLDCFFCYCPTVAQKYPTAHKYCPQYFFLISGNSPCNSFDDLPLRYCTILLGAIFVGHDNSMWTWSLPMLPWTIVTPIVSHPWRSSSLNRSPITLCSTLYRYFVTHTTWYFISYTVWLPFFVIYHSCSHFFNIVYQTTTTRSTLEAVPTEVGGIKPGTLKINKKCHTVQKYNLASQYIFYLTPQNIKR